MKWSGLARTWALAVSAALALTTPAWPAPAAANTIVYTGFVGTSVTADGLNILGRYYSSPGSSAVGTVPTLGGQFVKLIEQEYGYFALSPTGDRLIVHGKPTGLTTIDYNDPYRIWSIPVRGGTPIALGAPTLDYNWPVPIFTVAPNGQRLVYLEASKIGNGPEVLRSRPIDGSAPGIRLSPETGIVCQWVISQDGRWVVIWVGDSFSVSTSATRRTWSIVNSRLLRVPLDGPNTSVLTLESTPAATGVYAAHALSPDGSHLVYVLDGVVWSVDLESGNKVRLSPPGVTYHADNSHLMVTADSSRVIWDAGSSGPVFSTPVAGPANASVDLSVALPGPLSATTNNWSWLAPLSGAYAVMRVTQAYYAVPTSGQGAAVLLVDGGVQGINHRITPDRFVYSFAAGTYSIPFGGPTGTAVQVLATPVGDNWMASPDGSMLVGRFARGASSDVFSVPTTGPAQAAHNESIDLPGFVPSLVSDWRFTPDGKRLIIVDGAGANTYVLLIGSGPQTLRLSTDCVPTDTGVVTTPTPSQIHQLFLTSVGRCILTASSP